MKQQSLFLTFEGPEGSGKSTAIKLLSEWLDKNNIKHIVTREPGGSDIAEQIRSVILCKTNTAMDATTEAFLYAASRRQHIVETINPALENNIVVLCDRYVDSSLVYQGVGRKLGIDYVFDINKLATQGLLPKKTFFFDVHPEVGMKRIEDAKRTTNRLDDEKIQFHIDVYNAYLELCDRFKDRYISIAAEKDVESVFEQLRQQVEKLLNED